MAVRRWIIDKRWVVYAKDQDAALQKFWAHYPNVLGDFSQLIEDVAREIVQDGFYAGSRTDEEIQRELPIDLRWKP